MVDSDPTTSYKPIFELTRGESIESVHFGAFAVVDSDGTMIASYGDLNAASFLRSSAKPFQALPFIEAGGHERWDFTQKEIAILCASHSGTDEHFGVLSRLQAKIRVSEADLLCGVHAPGDKTTRLALERRSEHPTANRHNCSGKHTGMLAFARLTQTPIHDYINFNHPIQKQIQRTFSEMCDVALDEIALGVDGCSAPVFAIPLLKAAYGYARLCDPKDLDPERAAACQILTGAMMGQPEMVAGPGKFDTRLMDVCRGKIVSKGGSEGYQQIGIMPGALGEDSPGVGIALKISDGDSRSRVRPAVVLEILHQLKALDVDELQELHEFGPRLSVRNWRNLIVGESYPIIQL